MAITRSPQGFLTRQQVRDVDRRAIEEFGVPSVVLMENAGRGVAELLISLGIHGPVVICCGKGNNGGDGLVIARHLHNRGVRVRVLLFAQPDDLSPDAAVNFRILERASFPTRLMSGPDVDVAALRAELQRAEWTVDALFGTGLTGPLRAPFDQIVQTINSSASRILAVDIPSGLDCDTGISRGPTIRAQHTATFVAPKAGYANPEAAAWLGKVHVIDIGCPSACGLAG
jgi:NAD(P)H-hydrate epimerase